jgi:indole-3-glycerol phosphate synthase
MTILEKIVEQTKSDLNKRKLNVTLRDFESFEQFEGERRGFRQALSGKGLSVIAEVKKASPSKGIIREDFNHLDVAESYVEHGASAISVLTDTPFFQGRLNYLEEISKRFDIPLLRKDFIVDPYQIAEARAYGADAVLLIASVTEGKQLDELLHAAVEYGLDALVECYTEAEVRALDWQHVSLFGMNNRDLHTFKVDLHHGVELLQLSPEETIRVSESGLSTAEDLKYLVDHQIDAALIGEHFMRQPDPGKALAEMLDQLNELIYNEESLKQETGN